MLNNNKIFNVLFLALFFSLGLSAQNAKTESSETTYKQAGWWEFGINAGSSYQSSDVCRTYDGWGLGLTLAKNVYYKPDAPLAFNLRGRLLYANQIGQDWERSYGLQNNVTLNGTSASTRDFINEYDLNYLSNPSLTADSFYYANHRTDLGELGLEGVINLNRLRERNKIIVNLYGGLNLDWYKTRTNQANDNGLLLSGNEYDYSGINTTDKSTALSELESIMDNTYESVADGFDNEYGTFTWMPSLGVELGYQFTPRFSIIAGHKVTWSRDDILDGQRWTNDNMATGDNDVYHYTNIGLRWIIDPHEHTMDPPLIKIIRPTPLPHATQTAYVNVKAEIENVSSSGDVNCTFNGSQFYNFAFNPKSENFTCGLDLVPGKNVLVITATNMVGQDTEDVVIIYNEPIAPPVKPTLQPPVVKITRPSSSGKTVDSPNYTLQANVRHVDSRNDIKYYVNGSLSNSYTYSFNTDKFESNLTLQEGKNTIRIEGTNKDGSEQDQAVIIYEVEEAPCPRPTVDITNISNPAATPINPNVGKSTLSATIKHVTDRSQIKLYINGDRMTDFSFNVSTGQLTATMALGNGNNNIRIVVKTDCGSDEDKETVKFNAVTPNQPTPPSNPTNPVQQPPIVDISSPNNGSSTNNSTINVVGSVKHVTSKNQIRVTLNGSNYSNFSYYNGGVTINNMPIKVGNNVVEIKATNNAGTDSDDILVIRNDNTPPPCPMPIVNINNLSVPAATPINPTAGKSTLNATVKNVTSKNQIKLYVNNVLNNDFSFNAGNGAVSATLNLVQGNNTVKLVATTGCGNAQDTETVNFTPAAAPTPAPVVNIIKPQNGQNFTTPSTQLSATVLNVTSKNDITVKINGTKTTSFTFNASTKNVIANVNLQEGKNTIEVSATNAGGTASDSKVVNYNKPVQVIPPVVNINKPSNGSTVSTDKVTLKATVLNVPSKSDVVVKLNGVAIPGFSLSGTTVTAQLTVKEGNNTIQVIGKNNDGQDQKSVTVQYVKPVPEPTVKITSPNKRGNTETKKPFTIKAVLTNVPAKNNIKFLFNGSAVNAFSYDANTGQFSAPVTLKGGRNNIKITATTPGGKASAATFIIYSVGTLQIGNKPTVNIQNVSVPAATPLNPNSGKSTLIAKTNYISNKEQITVTVNGTKLQASNITFDKAKGEVVANLEFRKGRNTVKVTVKNANGEATDIENISF